MKTQKRSTNHAATLCPKFVCSCRAAIRFVLNDIFTSVPAQERAKLLHVRYDSAIKSSIPEHTCL